MKVAVLNQKGEKIKDMEMPKSFDVEVSPMAVTQYINYLRASIRDAVANTKDRSEVSGGGKKPWKQKGTGRARHGSSRSPLWVGGGVTFGPSSDQNFKQRINKNLKKKVILNSVASTFKNKKAIVVDTLSLSEIKTKNAVEILNNIKAEGKINLVFDKSDENVAKSFRNIAGVKLAMPEKMNVIDLLSANNVVYSLKSVEKINEIFAKNE